MGAVAVEVVGTAAVPVAATVAAVAAGRLVAGSVGSEEAVGREGQVGWDGASEVAV